MMEHMKKRKSETSGAEAAAGEGAESQPDVKDMMKQLGEMMKKSQPPQSGQ